MKYFYDWNKRVPKRFRSSKEQVMGFGLTQDRVVYTRKRKNACKLVSSADAEKGYRKSQSYKGRFVACRVAFPPIPL